MAPAHRRDLPEDLLLGLLLHQMRYSQHRQRRRQDSNVEELVNESARECWSRAGIILLYSKYTTPEIKDTMRIIAKDALEEIQTCADSANERYTRPGQTLIQTDSGIYRASSLLLAHQRYCGSQSIEIYQKLLIFGISVDQELYDLITHLGSYIPRHESIPFPILRRAAQSILPLRSVEDGYKRQRSLPPKPTNDLTEDEALLRNTILTGANAKQLFKLALETRDYLLAQYLYTYLRPSSVLVSASSSSSPAPSDDYSPATAPLLRRRTKRGENRFLWTSEDTSYFISFFRSLAHDSLSSRHHRSSKERLASLASSSVLYEHWMKDENGTPANIGMEIVEVAIAQIVPEQSEKMWSMLLKDQSFTFEMLQLEKIITKLKSWNNEAARQKAYIVSKKLLAPKSRYAPLISQQLYTLLLQTFAALDLPETSTESEVTAALKAALKPFDEVWTHLLKHGQPDLQAYNIHLQLRARTQEYETSIKLWKNMLKSAVVPDRTAYGYGVQAYVNKGDLVAAAETVKQASSARIVLKEDIISMLLQGAKEAGQAEVALQAHEEWTAVSRYQEGDLPRTEGAKQVLDLVEECKASRGLETLETSALAQTRTGAADVKSTKESTHEQPEECVPAVGFREPATPAVGRHNFGVQESTAPDDSGKPFLAAFFTSNDCASPEVEQKSDVDATVIQDTRRHEPMEEETTFLAPALAFHRSPTISFPSLSLSQASPAPKLSEQSIFASAVQSSSSRSRNYHPANTWEAMLDLAQKAREQLDNYACREQALQLADNRLRLGRADMGRWNGWKEHHATPWY
jgi:hypothetical protein